VGDAVEGGAVSEQPSVEALVERVRQAILRGSYDPQAGEWRAFFGPDTRDEAHAALDSLTAALERAERERDEARVYERQEARNYWIASRNEWKARAQKAEAALREIIEEFRHGIKPGKPITYEEDDPVVIIARRALAHKEEA
jgi:hypothetical protein